MFEAVSMLSPADTKCSWFTMTAKQYEPEAPQPSMWLSKLLAVLWFSVLACLSFYGHVGEGSVENWYGRGSLM